MTEQPDTDAVTWVTAADYDRIVANLDEPEVVNERIRAAAQRMRLDGLADLFTRPDVFTSPTPDRDGYTIAVYLPPGVTEAERDRMFDAVADAAIAAEGQGWDAHVVGVPGDPLCICHEATRD